MMKSPVRRSMKSHKVTKSIARRRSATMLKIHELRGVERGELHAPQKFDTISYIACPAKKIGKEWKGIARIEGSTNPKGLVG